MTREVMIKGDWWRQVQAVAHPRHITWQAQPIEVSVDFPRELYERLDKDPLLLQKLSDGGSEAYKAFVQECAGHVRWADALLDKAAAKCQHDHDAGAYLDESNRIHKGFAKLMSESAKEADGKIKKGIMDAWKAAQQAEKDYRSYKINAAVSIVLHLGGIAFAAAKLVASIGTDPFAWRGGIKDLIRMGDELITLAKEAETVRARAVHTIRKVADWHEKFGNGKLAATAEVGLMLLKTVIGTSFNSTYAAAANDVKAYASKLGGVDAKAHGFAQKLQGLLVEMDRSRSGAPKEIEVDVQALQRHVSDLIEQVIALEVEVRDGKVWVKDVGQLLVDLQKAQGIAHAEKILKGLETLFDTGMSVYGWVKFADKGGNVVKKIGEESLKLAKNVDRWKGEIKELARVAHT